MQQLIATESPKHDESLDSFILRLTEANAYATPDWIRHMIGVSPAMRMQFCKEEQLRKLADLATAEKFQLNRMALYHEPTEGTTKKVLFMNQAVPLYFVNKSSARYCPICLQEDPYLRQVWDLTAYTVCHHHGVYLLNQCPYCGRSIQWSRPGACSCSCGCDLREAQGILAEDDKVSLLIAAKLGLADTKVIERDNRISSIPLLSILRLLALVVGIKKLMIDTTGKNLARRSDILTMNAELAEAYHVFDNWPIHFINMIDDQLLVNNQPKRWIAKLHRIFRKEFDGTESFIYDTFVNYALEKHPQAISSRSLEQQFKPLRRYLSMSDAKKLLKSKDESVERLLCEGHMQGIISSAGKRKFTFIRKESVEEIWLRMKKGLSLKETSRILGIGEVATADLAKSGLLTVFRCPDDGYSKWMIDLDSIWRLQNAIREICKLKYMEDTLTFYQTMRKVSPIGISIGEIIQSVLEEKIQVFQSIGTGITGMLFLHGDILALLDDKGKELQKVKGLTVQDVALHLGIKQEVVAFWIDKGFIEADINMAGNRKKRLVSEESLHNFKEKYVIGVQAAKNMGISGKSFANQIILQGVSPISGPNIDEGRQYLFNKEDIISLF